MDRIIIRELTVRCIIGIYPEERENKQDVVLTIVMEADLHAAGRSDEIADTVDYKAIKKRILKQTETSRFQLIESIAEQAASICLEDPRVERVWVTVDKPGALRFAQSVAVEVERTRQEAQTGRKAGE